LPENCSIADQLPQIENDQLNENSSEDENDNDNMVTCTFVPSPPPSHSEELIKNTLNQIQFENPPMTWPQIDNSPIIINECQTPGYIAMAFPTLYPIGKADLCAEHIRDIKPAEYFKHLLRYKDGRFGQHTCWHYSALNSQM